MRRLAAAFAPAHGGVPNGLDESSVPSASNVRTLLTLRTKSGGEPPHPKARYAQERVRSARQTFAPGVSPVVSGFTFEPA
jgi:hypothetical protein